MKQNMKIRDIRATTVTVPLEAAVPTFVTIMA